MLLANTFTANKQKKTEFHNMPQNSSFYLDDSGDIIIPSNSDAKYHYWNGGQPLSETLKELTEKPYPENAVWTIGNRLPLRSS